MLKVVNTLDEIVKKLAYDYAPAPSPKVEATGAFWEKNFPRSHTHRNGCHYLAPFICAEMRKLGFYP